MKSTTPYLIRAIYDWCEDQGFTPHLLVDTGSDDVVVPHHLVENNSIVLNIQSSAVRNLELGNDWILFNTRFSGKSMEISLPVQAVRGIFARENGMGCAFEVSEVLESEKSEENSGKVQKGNIAKRKPVSLRAGNNKPSLKLVD